MFPSLAPPTAENNAETPHNPEPSSTSDSPRPASSAKAEPVDIELD